MPEVITSAANPLIKRVRLLGDRRHRRREGAFVVQGIQPVWQAVEAGADIEVLIVAPGLLREPAASMVAKQERNGVAVARLSDELFGRIADRDSPPGLAAIVRGRLAEMEGLRWPPAPEASLPAAGRSGAREPAALRLAAGLGPVLVALHEPGNPGNVGTIVRTADAAGAAGVVLIGNSADPFDPASVKASMGAIFSVPLARAASAEDFFGWCAARGVAVAATSGGAAEDFWDTPIPRPCAILLGSEGTGLPAALLERSDLRLRIPMTGTAESLNLAVAAGLVLYEAWRTAPSRRGA